MDRNNIIGFVLIFVVLMLWSYFNSKQHEAQLIQQRTQDSIAQAQAIEDSIRQSILKGKSGALNLLLDTVRSMPTTTSINTLQQSDTTTKASEVILENELIKLTLNSYGGSITSAQLKKYSRMEEMVKGPDVKSPLYLLNNSKNGWNLALDLGTQKINTKDIIFQTDQSNPSTVSFSATKADGKKIIQTYSLQPDSYVVDYSVSLPGGASTLTNKSITLDWQNLIEAQEKNASFEKTRS